MDAFRKKTISLFLIISFILPIFANISNDVYAMDLYSDLKEFVSTLNDNNFYDKKHELENKIIDVLQSQGFSIEDAVFILEQNPLEKKDFLEKIEYINAPKNIYSNASLFSNNGDERDGPTITITAKFLNTLGYGATISAPILGWGLSKSQWASAIVAVVGWKVVFASGVLFAVAATLAYYELYGYSKVTIKFKERYIYDEYEGMGKWYTVDADVTKEK